MHDEASVAKGAHSAPAATDYAVKRESGPRIIDGIRAVLDGKFYASPSLTAQLAGRMFGARRAQQRIAGGTAQRSRDGSFRLRGQGNSAKGNRPSPRASSVKTVGSYDARIKEKLGYMDAR